MNEHRDCPYNYLVAQEGLRDHEDQCKLLIAKQHEFEDRFTRLSLDHDKYYHAYHELKNAAIALVQRLELDKDVKKNNWWLNERAKIMEVIDDMETTTTTARRQDKHRPGFKEGEKNENNHHGKTIAHHN